MYCVKCGVELADSERKCPLCETPVYFPGLDMKPEKPYPEFEKPKESSRRRAIMFVITCFFVIAAATSVLCDVSINMEILWADYVISGLLLAYVLLLLPVWFKHPSPAVFVPCDFAAILLFLFYINYKLVGDWFFSFAMPVTLGAGVICSSVAILSYYLCRGKLYIAAGAFVASGAYCVFIEVCLHAAFHLYDRLVWSLYPAVILALVGIMLIVVAIVKPLREQLYKIFSF